MEQAEKGVRWCRCAEEAVQHSSGWLTLFYRLPSHLPDYAHLTLRSVEVAAVMAATSTPGTPCADACLGYVGMSMLWLTSCTCVVLVFWGEYSGLIMSGLQRDAVAALEHLPVWVPSLRHCCARSLCHSCGSMMQQ